MEHCAFNQSAFGVRKMSESQPKAIKSVISLKLCSLRTITIVIKRDFPSNETKKCNKFENKKMFPFGSKRRKSINQIARKISCFIFGADVSSCFIIRNAIESPEFFFNNFLSIYAITYFSNLN